MNTILKEIYELHRKKQSKKNIIDDSLQNKLIDILYHNKSYDDMMKKLNNLKEEIKS